MSFNIIKKIQQSLFLKIILTFLISFLLFTFGVMLFHRYMFKNSHFVQMQRNTTNYVNYLIKEIGSPVDTLIAGQIAKEMNIDIRIEDQTVIWTNNKNLQSFDEVDIPWFDEQKNIRAGFDKGLFVELTKNDTHYLFAMERQEEGFNYAAEVNTTIMIVFTSFILLLIYLVLRWQLKPVRTLHDGITELSKGNLDLQIATDRSDELGQLIHSFNDMINRIKERIHARDRLLLDVSHELRSPITRTKVALEFLEDEKLKRNIADDIGEIENMITEILETERLKSPHGGLYLETINLNQLIQEIVSEFSERNPGIKLLNLTELINLNADANRIRILLRNVIDNALKYSKPDGYQVEISIREKVDELIIEVQDFGQGIPEKDIPYIFEPFFRVDKSRSKATGGYGLGMNMSRQIMEAHGGTIEISSKLNVGTTVYLKFIK